MNQYNILLEGDRMPDYWYNIAPDLPVPMDPPLHPGTLKPLGPTDLAAIFPEALIEQEMSQKPAISIPGEVMDVYRLWRPTPLRRAYRLEKALGTPAKIFYKNESVSPSGSHKINTSAAQVYYNKMAGIKEMATETGAGQWGTALSIACSMFGLKCTVYMVRVSYEQKPYRRVLMQTYGGKVIASPSDTTDSGRSFLAKDPNTTNLFVFYGVVLLANLIPETSTGLLQTFDRFRRMGGLVVAASIFTLMLIIVVYVFHGSLMGILFAYLAGKIIGNSPACSA